MLGCPLSDCSLNILIWIAQVHHRRILLQGVMKSLGGGWQQGTCGYSLVKVQTGHALDLTLCLFRIHSAGQLPALEIKAHP